VIVFQAVVPPELSRTPYSPIGSGKSDTPPDVAGEWDGCGFGSELPLRRMPVWSQTVLLLVASNIFMTFAWYAHLKNLSGKPWWIAVLASWGIALFEYMLQVPANRIGYRRFNLAQLKILQEVITLSVFAPFAVIYMGQTLRWNYLAAFVCLLGAVYFAFR